MNIRAAPHARIRAPARNSTHSERTIMLHVFTLLSVPEYSADALVRSIRQGGEWHAIARHLLPDLIATDLLERSEEHTSELQSLRHLVCRLLLDKTKHMVQTIFSSSSQLCFSWACKASLSS